MGTLAVNLQTLEAFLKDSTTVSAITAATAIANIAHETLTSSQTSIQHVNLAKLALVQFCKNPQLGAIPPLLAVCDKQVSIYNVNAFLLSSTAWKALTATCIKFSNAEQDVTPEIRLRVLQSAVEGATASMRGMVEGGNRLDGLAEVSRALKVAKFHCVNAARCSKAFAKMGRLGTESEEEIVRVLSDVLYLVAFVSFVSSFDVSVPQNLRSNLNSNIAPPLGSVMHSVLAMVPAVFENGSWRSTLPSIASVVQLVMRAEGVLLNRGNGLTDGVLKVFVLLHLIRHAAGTKEDKPGHEEAKSGENLNRGIDLCAAAFQPALLPALFVAMESSYVAVVTLKEVETGILFIDMISNCIEDCVERLRTVWHPTRMGQMSLEDYLLTEMSALNPARALISRRCLVRLMESLNSVINRKCLLLKVMQCARISLSLRTGHLASRWIPLAGALAQTHVKNRGNLGEVFREYIENGSGSTMPSLDMNANAIGDPILLHILAKLCEIKLVEINANVERGVKRKSANLANEVGHDALSSIGSEIAKLGGFIKGLILRGGSGRSTTEAALSLLPHIMDDRTLSGTALACLKRKDLTAELYAQSLNLLNPAVMSSSALQMTCARMSNLVQTFGLEICAAVTAFVSRAAMSLHENVSLNDWQGLAQVLELAVLTCVRKDSAHHVRHMLLEASVLNHSAIILQVTNEIACASPGRKTQATIPKRILRIVEDAQAKLLQLRDDGVVGSSSRLAHDYKDVERELAYGKGELDWIGRGDGEDNKELERVRNELVNVGKRITEKIGGGGKAVGEVKQWIVELKDLVAVIDGAVEKKMENGKS